jgi:Armadillo/beta-catenin-like repeat
MGNISSCCECCTHLIQHDGLYIPNDCVHSPGTQITSLRAIAPRERTGGCGGSPPVSREYVLFCLSQRNVSLKCLLIDRTTTNFFTGSPLSALTTLSFSDNVDLQRSAALAFAEITEKEVRPVGRDTLDPILFLLSSHDTEVQRAASAALGNLAVNSG